MISKKKSYYPINDEILHTQSYTYCYSHLCVSSQVGSRSPYGEGTINIFATPELSRRGKEKKMSGTAYIGEWITERFYSTSSVSKIVR